MHFLLGIILVIGFLALCIAYPAFRNATFVLIGLVTAVIIWGIWQNNKQEEQRTLDRAQQQLAAQAYQQRAANLISPADLEIRNPALRNAYSDRWEIKGLVQNNSKYELTGVSFRLILMDCTSQTQCLTVGDQIISTRALTVPAGQARAFEAGGDFKNLPEKTQFQWRYTLTGASGTPN